jgi:hypothetical protein
VLLTYQYLSYIRHHQHRVLLCLMPLFQVLYFVMSFLSYIYISVNICFQI